MGVGTQKTTALDRATQVQETQRISAAQAALDRDERRRRRMAQNDPLVGPGGQLGTNANLGLQAAG